MYVDHLGAMRRRKKTAEKPPQAILLTILRLVSFTLMAASRSTRIPPSFPRAVGATRHRTSSGRFGEPLTALDLARLDDP